MKVAIVFDNFGPYHLARLKTASQVCTVFALEMNRRSSDYAWQPDAGPRSFDSSTLNDSRAPGFLKLFLQARMLQRNLTELSPDCVFVPGWSRAYSLESLRWCVSNRIPAIVMSETTEYDAPRSGWKEWLKTRFVRACCAALVGGTLHKAYLQKLGMASSKIFQGYDVVDNDYFRQRAQAARERACELRQSFNLPAQYFLASARFIEKKNLCRLIIAFAKYRSAACGSVSTKRTSTQSEPWSLVLLGDGEQKPALQKLISELGLDAFVLLPGFKQYGDLPVYYGLANAFVHASTSEPWGLVVNEAMASGLPALVSNQCGCAPDLVREGRNGFTFDPDNVEQLAELMLRLSDPKSPNATMGKASAEIMSCWGLSRFSRALLGAIESAVANRMIKMSPAHRAPSCVLKP
jgi:1,2-diacylglycerol 3-alpha-glucosyltransferase